MYTVIYLNHKAHKHPATAHKAQYIPPVVYEKFNYLPLKIPYDILK